MNEVAILSKLPPAYAEREAELQAFLERSWPKAAPSDCHRIEYTVAHDLLGTWVLYSLYATRDERGQLVPRESYQRFACIASGWVQQLNDSHEHGYGVCPECTLTWRQEHGLGSDISDVYELPEGLQELQAPS